MGFHFRGGAALAFAFFCASPAFAQGIIPSVIGSTIANMAAADWCAQQCLSGQAPKAKLRAWSSAGQPGDVAAVEDPLARALAAGGGGLPPPATFILSGDLRRALGIWVVPGTGPDAAPLGHYRVSFRPEGPFLPEGGQIWRITSLELIPGAADPEPATQFCSKPGDVEEYLAAVAKFKEERARKKAEKAAARAAARDG